MPSGTKRYFEYRGVSDAVYAKITADDSGNYTAGEVKYFTGLSEVGKSVDSETEAHYYDNQPVIIISSTGATELSLNTSGIPFDILADITGQYYDEPTGMFVEQERDPGYYAFGYVTQKTDGSKVLVWHLKGSFSIPESTHNTQDDGTDANGQELTFTGVNTTHKFTATGKSAKSVNIDTSVNTTLSEEAFFSAVQTPDTIKDAAGTKYTLTFDVGAGDPISAVEYSANTQVTLPTPTYTGHTFEGWYLESDFSGTPVTTVTMTADTTVYAKWDA